MPNSLIPPFHTRNMEITSNLVKVLVKDDRIGNFASMVATHDPTCAFISLGYTTEFGKNSLILVLVSFMSYSEKTKIFLHDLYQRGIIATATKVDAKLLYAGFDYMEESI